ncbi:uncharacterized protein MCYG_00365 [Microsporum canis CBS 113480]|uniref:Uncharacterized protein n=1 Tax=Arthroderma otae (strain ATCC MYA-4605 / CBS 113480) TaxID=554155 RepID=C5FC54_ARTOC|nr:uncharacterized protein MCYG_00365 [Microsporum canis CBS 113480]EEQ27477.1 predicted protein [Microsporum canis CBS 113480]
MPQEDGGEEKIYDSHGFNGTLDLVDADRIPRAQRRLMHVIVHHVRVGRWRSGMVGETWYTAAKCQYAMHSSTPSSYCIPPRATVVMMKRNLAQSSCYEPPARISIPDPTRKGTLHGWTIDMFLSSRKLPR